MMTTTATTDNLCTIHKAATLYAIAELLDMDPDSTPELVVEIRRTISRWADRCSDPHVTYCKNLDAR